MMNECKRIGHILKQSDVVISNTIYQCYTETLTRICNVHSGSRTNSALSQRERAKNVKNLVPMCLNALVPTKKKAAFTLAEVLITLGIIGVVTALTIPSLITNYKAHRLRSQFLKSYSVVQQVFKQMESDDVSLDPASYARQSGSFYRLFKNYLTGITDCGTWTTKASPCANVYNLNYKNFDKSKTVNSYYFDDGQIILPDGTLLIFENPAAKDYLWVLVDINGYNNPPNIWGYDLFTFEFLDGELRTMGDKGTTYNDMDKYCSLNSTEYENEIACASKAKTNPDYFKEVVQEFK